MSGSFSPIAVVGQGCVLPGAFSPQKLWENVAAKRDLVTSVPEGRWKLRPEEVLAPHGDHADFTTSTAGAYVTGFNEIFEPAGFAIPGEEIAGYDPLVAWLCHAGRDALCSAGLGAPVADPEGRIGLILGNLSFPTESMAAWGEASYHARHGLNSDEFWSRLDANETQAQRAPLREALAAPRSINRFMSGLPAQIAARALGLQGTAFCLDAACASSLYAIALAAQWLHQNRADVVLAGAVNRADSLFLHMGFSALQALSPSGRSRPFHHQADGLVPGEGAGMVALMRLDDAIAQKRPIAGVIRGVGLSNDGRAKNLLAPSSAGQVRAMRSAYAQACWGPENVSLIECHATGTPTGDGTELESMEAIFAGLAPREVAIGSLKSNLGHLITAAGVAGLQKVLGAMAHEALPPTLHVDVPHSKLEDGRSVFRAQTELSEWPEPRDTPRRAAVSAFGFGGNNAHLLVEAWQPKSPRSPRSPLGANAAELDSQMSLPGVTVPPAANAGARLHADEEIAIVAMGARCGSGTSQADLYAQIFGDRAQMPLAEKVRVEIAGLRFPPNDLKDALPQQALVFEAAREAMENLAEPPSHERLAILVGMQCDVDVTTPGIRWRMPQRSAAMSRVNGDSAPQKAWRKWGHEQKDQVAPPLTAARVLGQMPNIPANRINLQLDCQGPGFTVSAEELSGIAALDVACGWLQNRAIDCALVGAVDVCGDARHQEAMRDRLGDACPAAGDAAIVLVIKRLADARTAGETVLARVGPIHHGMKPLAPPTNAAEGSLWVEASAGACLEAPHKTEASIQGVPHGSAEIAAPRWRVADHLGHAHAASGLLGVAVATLACHTQTYPPQSDGKPTVDETGPTRVWVHTESIGGAFAGVEISTGDTATAAQRPAPSPAMPKRSLGTIEIAAHRNFEAIQPPGFPRPPSSNHLPSAVAAMHAANSKPQIMAPAPALPSVTHARVAVIAAPAEPPRDAAFASVEPAIAAAISPPGAPPAGAAHALLQARMEMTRAHQAFLESQGTAQQAFLVLQQRNVARLQLLDAATPVISAPVPAAPPPSAAVRSEMPHPGVSPLEPNVTQSAKPIQPNAQTDETARAAPKVEPTEHASSLYVSPPPLWSRSDLETLASGRISEVFGDLFRQQDGFSRQVRMPTPPLLLCDRVMSIEAEPGVLRPHTTIRTETDVERTAWYLHEGRMPPGVLIEAGQADLLLISYMGVDFENRGERVYRLLGCDLTYHSALPEVGTLLHFDIHIDGFATQGDTRIFFFHSDCRKGGPTGELVLSVRNGQAGFFTDEELAHSGGILWSPEVDVPDLSARPLDAPAANCTKNALERADLEAWAQGDAFACFGSGFEFAQTHVATPRPPAGDMLLFDRVTQLSPAGGPWQRGYLRAELDLQPDSWFFQGHFKDDPCMPGTMMFEGCLETLQLYLTSQGHTLHKDGWRFEPLHGELFALRCRGQATPASKLLVYEVFIKEIVGGDRPRVVADILATVDGLKALHCKDVGVELVPDWPLTRHPELLGETEKTSGWDAVGGVSQDPMAQDVVFDQRSLLATAWGRPSEAFGAMYAPFDDGRRVPRLPGPPYHFMSRVTHVEGPPQGVMKAGGTVRVDYDVPPDAWYFEQGTAAVMPFAVLLEVALQPCGWLSSYVGSALTSAADLCYRNLDGAGKVHCHIPPDIGTLTTSTTLTKVSQSAGMIIQEFALAVHAGDRLIFDATTAFGFFPPAALERQVGLAPPEHERSYFAQTVEPTAAGFPLPLDLTSEPAPYFGPRLSLPAPMLRMIDRVTGYLPDGGCHEAGWVRAEKTVDTSEWFFRAHFFTDPVQPGSLGLEAMVQTLQWWMLHQKMGQHIEDAVFEPIAREQDLVWRYRGQVVPANGKIEVELHIGQVQEQDDEGYPRVAAEAWLWVDGLRIYRANLGMRIVPRHRLT